LPSVTALGSWIAQGSLGRMTGRPKINRNRQRRTIMFSTIPIIQAPMAGTQGPELCIAVCKAGGLGSLPCAMLTPKTLREQIASVRAETTAPFNVNFFTHKPPRPDTDVQRRWLERLAPYYAEVGLDPAMDDRSSPHSVRRGHVRRDRGDAAADH
jgi:NAD(P)H-dependent flavin oxidoreductase YrpB (nitropropane dioxygenase family)